MLLTNYTVPICSSCNRNKDDKAFYRGRRQCIKCLSDKAKARRKPEYVAAERARYIKRTYGITAEEYDRLLQEKCCSLCESTENLVLDHCHQTGKLREALCSNCNKALGFAKDDPELLRKMAEYIDQHRRYTL